MTPGTHGTTFGGNPLAMAVGEAVIDVILAPGFLDHVRAMSLYFKQRLASVVDHHPDLLAEVRGEGLLLGMRCVVPSADIVAAFRNAGLLSVGAGDNVVRLLPPLIVTEKEIDAGIAMIEAGLAALAPAKVGAA
jgi:acetylornithine/N-succinyldiaminopimelate aminotransferase